MPVDYKIEAYRSWLSDNIVLSNPFSIQSLRDITYHVIMGRNYRLLTEPSTKGKLFTTFLWLNEIQNNAIEEFGEDEWIYGLLDDLQGRKRSPAELKNLTFWLMGLTNKTAVNLGLKKEDYPNIIRDTIKYFDELFLKIGESNFKNTAWLLLMAGSATLNIRGSQKSKVGKQLERVLLKATLTMLGFTHDTDFWMNIGRDIEVGREADAEVKSRRGRIRIEMGLIAPGNQEVIEDKIKRVERNGVIIFDKLGSKTRVHNTANQEGVRLIQIRNSNPLLDLYRHLSPLVDIELTEPSNTSKGLRTAIEALPDSIFTI